MSKGVIDRKAENVNAARVSSYLISDFVQKSLVLRTVLGAGHISSARGLREELHCLSRHSRSALRRR
jgi:hypothetical protein